MFKNFLLSAALCCFFNCIQAQSAYDSLLKKVRNEIAPNPITPFCRTVMIYRDNFFCGMGTYRPNENKIYTAGHHFLDTAKKSHMYSAEIFQPHQEKRIWITSVGTSSYIDSVGPNEKYCVRDVAVCEVDSVKGKPIWGKYKFKMMRPDIRYTVLPTVKTDIVYDAMTGKAVKFLARINFHTEKFSGWSYIVDIPAYQGRSGSGFLTNKQLFLVLSRDFEISSRVAIDSVLRASIGKFEFGKKYSILAPVNIRLYE